MQSRFDYVMFIPCKPWANCKEAERIRHGVLTHKKERGLLLNK